MDDQVVVCSPCWDQVWRQPPTQTAEASSPEGCALCGEETTQTVRDADLRAALRSHFLALRQRPEDRDALSRSL